MAPPDMDVMKVMVLAGGPDRERSVSLSSGANVAGALKDAGHDVLLRDVLPDDLSALDEFARWEGQVIFPILHGAWGEGGPLQEILDDRRFPYVGCRGASARLCMDKDAAKKALAAARLPTPDWQVLSNGDACRLAAPVVLKPPCEGSSIDVVIARTQERLFSGLAELRRSHRRIMVERFVPGRELTVGVIADAGAPAGLVALPPIQIVPATEFYDYQAKYHRDDTQYLFDLGLPRDVLDRLAELALRTFQVLGCRHLARVDLMLDSRNDPWILEVNTLPGFTSHSLVPKAAARAGVDLPALVDRLVRLAAAEA